MIWDLKTMIWDLKTMIWDLKTMIWTLHEVWSGSQDRYEVPRVRYRTYRHIAYNQGFLWLYSILTH